MKLNDKYFYSPAHLEIAKQRYFLKDDDKYIENDIDEVFNREVNYIYQNDTQEHRDKALQYRREKKILPAGRPLAQAGTKCKNLNNCYILGFKDDTREAISELKRQHFHIMSHGGGVGINFSTLRPESSILKTSLGHSSGAVGYITDLSYQSSNISQGGNRSGAGLALLEDWHPDLYEFIVHKKEHNWENIRKFSNINNEEEFAEFQWNNHSHWQMMNVSVGLSDKFIQQVIEESNEPWILKWKDIEWPLWTFKNKEKEIIVTAPNQELAFYKASSRLSYFSNKNLKLIKGPYHYTALQWFNLIAKSAWEDGCPGVIFLDRARIYHNLEYYAPLSATNPCQPSWATVLTPDGIRTIGQVNIGDKIWSGKQWTKIINKWSTGIKKVYEYHTTVGNFYGTTEHKIVSNDSKIEVDNATSIDLTVGSCATSFMPTCIDELIDAQKWVIDGLVIGDGSIHKASNNLVGLYIGKNDSDYFTDLVNIQIKKHRPGIKDTFYEVNTSITSKELPKTFERIIPDRYFYGHDRMRAFFLRGLFSANGSIVDRRITLKSSSLKLIYQTRAMLSSLGIASYYTTNKAHKTKFSNGTYICKESYDLNISSDCKRFQTIIGFIQKYKLEKLNKICEFSRKENTKVNYKITHKKLVSIEEVFDLTVDAPEHTYWTDGLLVSNCAEVYGSVNSVCNLSSIILPTFWKNNQFDFNEFKKVIYEVVRGLDNIIDLSYCGEKEIDDKAWLERRIGLGTTGVGELLLLAGLKYSSQEGRDFVLPILEMLRNEAYKASIKLAKERGPFSIFDYEKYKFSQFIKNLPKDIQQDIKQYGIRNGVLLAQAPVGSTGSMIGYSQGCEPYFAMIYKRNSKVGSFTDGSPCFNKWLKDNNIDYSKYNFSLEKLKEDIKVPEYFEEAHNISWQNHIKMQAIFAKYFDQSVSKTINMPNNSTIEDVKNAFIEAYKLGIKSTTIYRDGSKQQILEHIKTKDIKTKRAIELNCDIHHVSIKGEKWIVLVGLDNNKPYEIFAAPQDNFELSKTCENGIIIKKGKGKFSLQVKDFTIKDIASLSASDEHRSITRLISLLIRNNISLLDIISQLEKTNGSIVDFSKAIIRVLKKYLTNTEIQKIACTNCGSYNIVINGSCPQCLDCGTSKCG